MQGKFSPSAPPGLIVSGLAVERGENEVLSGVSFTVAAGEALLLRGRNGAGKSTLLLALAGLLRPSRGTIAWSGGDPERGPLESLHLVAHRSAIKARLTLHENLAFWAALQGGDPSTIPEALERVALGGLDDVDAGHLSAGQTRRLALARLIVSPRPVWLLDEPTAALDRDGHALVGTLIDTHLAEGGLVVAATHDDIPLSPQSHIVTLDLGRPNPVPA